MKSLHIREICNFSLLKCIKKKSHTASPIMPSLFGICRNFHNTRHFQVLYNKSIRRINYGLEITLDSRIIVCPPPPPKSVAKSAVFSTKHKY